MIKTSMIALIATMGLAGIASATPMSKDEAQISYKSAGDQLITIARRGADDPAGDDRGGKGKGKGRGKNDGAGHTNMDNSNSLFKMARRGADDPAGDDRGGKGKGKGRGKDDGVGHA